MQVMLPPCSLGPWSFLLLTLQAPAGLAINSRAQGRGAAAVTLQLAPAGRIWAIFPETNKSHAVLGLNTLNTSSPDYR